MYTNTYYYVRTVIVDLVQRYLVHASQQFASVRLVFTEKHHDDVDDDQPPTHSTKIRINMRQLRYSRARYFIVRTPVHYRYKTPDEKQRLNA